MTFKSEFSKFNTNDGYVSINGEDGSSGQRGESVLIKCGDGSGGALARGPKIELIGGIDNVAGSINVTAGTGLSGGGGVNIQGILEAYEINTSQINNSSTIKSVTVSAEDGSATELAGSISIYAGDGVDASYSSGGRIALIAGDSHQGSSIGSGSNIYINGGNNTTGGSVTIQAGNALTPGTIELQSSAEAPTTVNVSGTLNSSTSINCPLMNVDILSAYTDVEGSKISIYDDLDFGGSNNIIDVGTINGAAIVSDGDGNKALMDDGYHKQIELVDVYVHSLSDLPTPSGAYIYLETGKTYKLMGQFIEDYALIMAPGTRLIGDGPDVASWTTTTRDRCLIPQGTVENAYYYVRGIKFSTLLATTSIPMISNAADTSIYVFENCIFQTAAASSPTIQAYKGSQYIFNKCEFIGSNNGLTITEAATADQIVELVQLFDCKMDVAGVGISNTETTSRIEIVGLEIESTNSLFSNTGSVGELIINRCKTTTTPRLLYNNATIVSGLLTDNYMVGASEVVNSSTLIGLTIQNNTIDGYAQPNRLQGTLAVGAASSVPTTGTIQLPANAKINTLNSLAATKTIAEMAGDTLVIGGVSTIPAQTQVRGESSVRAYIGSTNKFTIDADSADFVDAVTAPSFNGATIKSNGTTSEFLNGTGGYSDTASYVTLVPTSGMLNTTGGESAYYFRLNPAAGGTSISGIDISAQTNKEKYLVNVSSYSITIINNDDSIANPADRMLCPSSTNFTLADGAAVKIWYDDASSGWRLIAS